MSATEPKDSGQGKATSDPTLSQPDKNPWLSEPTADPDSDAAQPDAGSGQ
jgi:hypothetical protein